METLAFDSMPIKWKFMQDNDLQTLVKSSKKIGFFRNIFAFWINQP